MKKENTIANYYYMNRDRSLLTLGHNLKPQNQNNNRFSCERFAVPSVALAIDWIREEKGIPCAVHSASSFLQEVYYFTVHKGHNGKWIESKQYNAFRQAESALLDSLLMELGV